MTTNDTQDPNQPTAGDPTKTPTAGDKQPTAPKKSATPPAGYVVVHTQVGAWVEGTELTVDDLKDIDIKRLVELGAIKKVG